MVLFSTGGGLSLKHTPWLLGRLYTLLAAVESKAVVFRKIEGVLNPTNSLTKYTPLNEFARDMKYLCNSAALEGDGDSTVGQLLVLLEKVAEAGKE